MAASVTNMVGPPRQEWIIITLWIPVEKFHLMLWLREGFINIQTVLLFAPHWHVHIAAYPAAEMEYTVCALLKGTAEVGVEGSAQRYSTSHTDLAVGGVEEKERRGEETTDEKWLQRELWIVRWFMRLEHSFLWIYQILQPAHYAIRKCTPPTDWKVWLEPRPLQTSQWRHASRHAA